MKTVQEQDITKVENFWNSHLCGSHFVNSKYLSKEFFHDYRKFRYKKEHHLNKIIDWKQAKNKDILEIGIGIGADATKWAKYAKSYTGIDLTKEAVIATKRHFGFLNLKGNIIQADSEKLPFTNNKFDVVYSLGVLHHTPNITKAFAEIYRVLKQNGIFIFMVYSKASFNYWIRIQFYFRIRLLFELLKNIIGLKSNSIWKYHIKNFQKERWSYLSWSTFPHHCTDGPDCEIANIYYKKSIIEKLKHLGFTTEKFQKAHFPLGIINQNIERFIAKYIGFHSFYWAIKSV